MKSDKKPLRHYFWETELHNFLLERLNDVPDLVQADRIKPRVLAKMVGKCDYTVYRWFNDNHLSAGGARAILRVFGDRMTSEELSKYLHLA
jgi:hypothetical protein